VGDGNLLFPSVKGAERCSWRRTRFIVALRIVKRTSLASELMEHSGCS